MGEATEGQSNCKEDQDMTDDCPRCKANNWSWHQTPTVESERVYLESECRQCGLTRVETYTQRNTHYEDHGSLYVTEEEQ